MSVIPKIRFKGFTDAWEQRKLGDVILDLKSGLSRQLSIEDIGLPVVRANNINDGKLDMSNDVKYWYENDPQGANTLNYLIHKNDILINFINSEAKMGTATIVEVEPDRRTIYTTNILRMQANTSMSDSYFLLYLSMTYDYCNYIKSITKPAVNQSSFTTVDYKKYLFRMPSLKEQKKIGEYFHNVDTLITLHQRKCDETKELKKYMLQKMFPKKGEKVPEIRFKRFTDAWEQRKFGELYKKVNEKNDLSFGTDKIISVANMYFKEDVKESRDDYMRTYNIMRLGDIAFEGNKSKKFSHGRFVENTIGDGIVSHVFDVFRPIMEYDILFWKYLINNENVMGRIMTRCTKASTMMTNLVAKDFLNEKILVPTIDEQRKIGEYFDNLDNLITLHQHKCDLLKELKKYMLQNMFPKEG